MAKRFLDTNVFDKEWFQELEPKFKLFWFYMISKCDHAGIWNVNMRMANFVINQSYTRDGVLGAFKDKSVIKILEDNQINSEDKGHARVMNGASKGLSEFVIPGLKDVIDHFKEKNYTNYAIEGAKFYHYYCSVDWKVGKHKMKSWHAAAAGWNTRIKDVPANKRPYVETSQIDNTY